MSRNQQERERALGEEEGASKGQLGDTSRWGVGGQGTIADREH